MTFFARPNLDNTQFKQLSGSTLTLSGQTQIATTSGLTLSDGNGGNIVITANNASPATDGYVLTYDDASKQICLALSSASGGSQNYCGISPTTCAVGGLPAGSPISGLTLSCIIQEIVAPVLSPTCSQPYNTLSLSPAVSTLEIGCNISFIAMGAFNQGSVSPVYCAGTSCRTGLPNCYYYVDSVGGTCFIPSSALSNSTGLATTPIHVGGNIVSLHVGYNAGQYPKKSDGTTVGMTCCPAGNAPTVTQSVNGILPYFYGSSTSLPVAGNALLATGTKVVADSTGDITVNYNVTTKYIWLAVPHTSPFTSPIKTKWYGSNAPTTNTEPIPGGLFNAPSTLSVNSPSSCWSGCAYNFYISNYPTSAVGYTLTFTN